MESEQMEITEKVKERFWSKVDKSAGPDGCWEWKGGKRPQGYGRYLFRGYRPSSHRVAWILTYGHILESLLVCHHCDNRLCCNPSHLFLGTHEDNMKDMVRKGRAAKGERHGAHRYPERWARGERHWTHIHPEKIPYGKGEKNGGAKLKASDVLSIREKYANDIKPRDLAKQYGITMSNIWYIVHDRSWTHLKSNLGG